MHTASAATRETVRRINAKLSPGRFLVAKRAAGETEITYCMATGDPATAKYEVTDAPVDLAELARSLGLAAEAA